MTSTGLAAVATAQAGFTGVRPSSSILRIKKSMLCIVQFSLPKQKSELYVLLASNCCSFVKKLY